LIQEAIQALRSSHFVLIHDDKGRENEIDMVIAGEKISPEHIAVMRKDGGGLICLAISHDSAFKLGLTYMQNILQAVSSINPVFAKLTSGKSPYGDDPSFSIAINHRDTYTGITDFDRALTISKMSEICKRIDTGGINEFANCFRAPGHVPLLIASKKLLQDRTGHTELCIYLAQLANLTAAVVICEMLDNETHRALSITKAKTYSTKYQIPLIEADELRACAKVA
jgi:3,4-dihydroxy 2-butanone 4-phosphate synthase